MGSHLPTHGHTEADIKALLFLIQGIINDDDAAYFLPFILIKVQHGGVVLRPCDVVGVRQDSGGDGASGSA